jgi:hypothetical protein
MSFYGAARTTFLTSRQNHLITLYDVNRRTCDSSLHSSDPYALTPSSNSERAGAHLLRHPSSTAPMSSFSLFELSDRHGLFHTEIGERKGGERESVSCEWDEGVQKLDDKAKDAKEDVGPHGEREFVRVDLRGAYERRLQFAWHLICFADISLQMFSANPIRVTHHLQTLTAYSNRWQSIPITTKE